MTTAFITGISGQDGGYLGEQLLAEGIEVHGLVRDDAAADAIRASMPTAILHLGDLNDIDTTAKIVKDIRPDEIYNLAGISSVAQSWAEPIATGLVSGVAAAGLINAAWEMSEATGRVVRFVQASSAEIFGDPLISPQDEFTPVVPVSPYGAAKAYAHHIVNVYRLRGLHAVSMVLYNHESPRRPPAFVTRTISQGVARIARGESKELILGNLDARRDWGWAPDYVAAMVLAARHTRPDDYVIATGVSHSVREFVEAAFRHAEVPDWERFVRVNPSFVRPVDAVELVGDAGWAYRELGWTHTVGFTEIVARMVDADLI